MTSENYIMDCSSQDTMNDSNVYEELYKIVCLGDLSNELEEHLKSSADVDDILQYFYQRDDQSFNLLILAALHGYETIVRTILTHSSNPKNLVELYGHVTGVNENLVSHATALWCACDRGHYTIARILIEEGKASVYHGPENLLLFDAIINERFDTIEFLIDNDYADINRTRARDPPYYNSLVLAAARGQTKIVTYLIGKGATIDYRTRANNTALGHAAMHGHFGVVQSLCSAGASTNIKNNNGETPLILAFENGHSDIVDYLLDLTSHELCIEELELIACSFVVPMRGNDDDQLEFEKMIHLMQKIFHLKKLRNTSKVIAKPIAAYNFHQECQTIEEFEQIQHDNNRLYIEALLMRERLLAPKKNQTLCEPLLKYGQKLIDQGDFEQCLHLWEHTFYLYQSMEHETSLHRFVWIFCKMLANKKFISPKLFLQICNLTFQPAEQNKKNHSIKNSLCLATIAVKVLEQPTLTKTDRQSIHQWINDLCRLQRTTTTGQTLLHLCVNPQTYRDINYRADEIKQVLNFPNLSTTQLLLNYGRRWIDVDAVDTSCGNTALHFVCQSTHTDALPIVKLLIDAGAHFDALNKQNKAPVDYVKITPIKTLLQTYQSPSFLKCLCARYIVAKDLNYELIWPTGTKLNSFLYLHGRIGKLAEEKK